jgi:beta-phosphoglucomutase
MSGLDTMKAALFDLDGVIVDTAKYHYLAWKRLAGELGIEFTLADNERLKGVSRTRSLEIVLELGGVAKSPAEQAVLAERKNAWYVEMISGMDASELLPGAADYLDYLRRRGVRAALGSASKNARTILDRLRITDKFDVIVDGTVVANAKPDPEVFLRGAAALGVAPADCAVFEDAAAGIEAAKRAGMYAVGIGAVAALPGADMVVPGLSVLAPRP